MRAIRRLIVLSALLAVLCAAFETRTEITGANAAVQVATTGTARWVQFVADPGNASAVRVNYGSTATATTGVRLAPGAGQMFPPSGQQYTLAYCYVYVATGDKVSVAWGN